MRSQTRDTCAWPAMIDPSRSRLRRLLGPGAMAAAMLAVLLGLGTWQVERLHWKQDVLSQIARAEAAPAVPLPTEPELYTKVQVTGRLRDDLSASYGAEVRDTPAGTQLGTQLVVPLERDGGSAILVDRGWVPDRRPRPLAQAEGDVTIEGYVRPERHARHVQCHRQSGDAAVLYAGCAGDRRRPRAGPGGAVHPGGAGAAAAGTLSRSGAPSAAPAEQPSVLRDHVVWPRHRARGDLRALGEKGAERMNAYDRLADRFARIATLGEASSVLNWDAATMMPPGGGAARGDQLAVLAGLSHSLLAAPVVGDDLAAAEAAGETDPWRAANLRLMRHAYIRATAMPPDLVEAQARANSACEKVWREARRKSDFAMVRPHLEEVVRLMREAAAALAPALGLEPVRRADGRLPARHAHCRRHRVFAEYEAFLRGALPRAEERQARNPRRCGRRGRFPSRCRRRCAARLAERLGLDFAHARLDRSAHPFSGGTPTDVRITSRYDETDFTQAVLARGARDRPRAVRARPAARPGRASRWARRPAWRRTRASR